MKRFGAVLLILLVLCAALPADAQQPATTIRYGQTVQGEISDLHFEIPYAFVGTSGDVIILQLAAVDVLSDLDEPALVLLDPQMRVLASVDGWINDVTLAAKLPADGTYTILATRTDGRAGDSVGAFNLSLLKPLPLLPYEARNGTVSSSSAQHFIIEVAGDFSVLYERTGGDFYPEVSIQQVGGDGSLEEVAVMQGDAFVRGMLGIEPQSSFVASTFVLSLRERAWEYNYYPVTADFSVMLTAGDVMPDSSKSLGSQENRLKKRNP